MKRIITAISAAAVALACLASGAGAQVPAYSFETIVPPNGPDGFFGLGATVSQEPTIGVTHLENSLKYQIGVGGFVGARTAVVPPTLNNPPGVTHNLLDLTLPQAYTGTFAGLGVTIFGHALNPGGPGTFGNQVQFADEVNLASLGAGTHLDQRIDLDMSVGPYRPGESFNAIFGTDPNDLSIASEFQFYVNKNALTPLTLYIDNVRFVPEPSASALLLAASAGATLARRRGRR